MLLIITCRVFRMEAPDINVTWEWVERLVEGTLEEIDHDIAHHSGMRMETAISTQKALVAALLSGCYCPPPRMSIIKSLIHPDYNELIGCMDADCLRAGQGCQGNHLEFEEVPMPPEEEINRHDWKHHGYLQTNVTNVIVHHKNDRRWVCMVCVCARNDSVWGYQVIDFQTNQP
jgi:hypothetical protein